MWYGRIRDINIWKEDSRSNRMLTGSRKKEVQSVDGTVTFYMGQQLLDADISMMNLSVRAYNCLKRAGWDTVGDILNNIECWQDLLRVRNLGKTSAIEIINNLKDYQNSILTETEKSVIIRRNSGKPVSEPKAMVEDRDLSELNLSVRSYNSLKRAGYNTVGELNRDIRGGKNLRDIRNLGATSEKEILSALGLTDLRLAD